MAQLTVSGETYNSIGAMIVGEGVVDGFSAAVNPDGHGVLVIGESTTTSVPSTTDDVLQLGGLNNGSLSLGDRDNISIIQPVFQGAGQNGDLIIQNNGTLIVEQDADVTINKTRPPTTYDPTVSNSNDGLGAAMALRGRLQLNAGSTTTINSCQSIGFVNTGNIFGDASDLPTLRFNWTASRTGGAGPRFRFDNEGGAAVTPSITDGSSGEYRLELSGNNQTLQLLLNGFIGKDKLPTELSLSDTVVISHNGLNSLNYVYDLDNLDLTGNSGLASNIIDVAPHSNGVGTGADAAVGNTVVMRVNNCIGRTQGGNTVFPKFGFNITGGNRSGVGIYYQDFRFTRENDELPVSIYFPCTAENQMTDSGGTLRTLPNFGTDRSFTHATATAPNRGTRVNQEIVVAAYDVYANDIIRDFDVDQMPVRLYYAPNDFTATHSQTTDRYTRSYMVDYFGIPQLNLETRTRDRYIHGSIQTVIGCREFDVMAAGRNEIVIPNAADPAITATVRAATRVGVTVFVGTDAGTDFVQVTLANNRYEVGSLINAIKRFMLDEILTEGSTTLLNQEMDTWPTDPSDPDRVILGDGYDNWLENVNGETGIFRIDNLRFTPTNYRIEADADYHTFQINGGIDATDVYGDEADFTKWGTVISNTGNITNVAGSETNWTATTGNIAVTGNLTNSVLTSGGIDIQGNGTILDEVSFGTGSVVTFTGSNIRLDNCDFTNATFGNGTATIFLDTITEDLNPNLVDDLRDAGYTPQVVQPEIDLVVTIPLDGRLLVQRVTGNAPNTTDYIIGTRTGNTVSPITVTTGQQITVTYGSTNSLQALDTLRVFFVPDDVSYQDNVYDTEAQTLTIITEQRHESLYASGTITTIPTVTYNAGAGYTEFEVGVDTLGEDPTNTQRYFLNALTTSGYFTGLYFANNPETVAGVDIFDRIIDSGDIGSTLINANFIRITSDLQDAPLASIAQRRINNVTIQSGDVPDGVNSINDIILGFDVANNFNTVLVTNPATLSEAATRVILVSETTKIIENQEALATGIEDAQILRRRSINLPNDE